MARQIENLDEAKAAAGEGLNELEQARELYAEFLEHWQNAMHEAARLGLHIELQAGAYQPFVRDQGMGNAPDAWFDSASRQFEDVQNADDSEKADWE